MAVSVLDQFWIDIYGLNVGRHMYSFTVENAFFEAFEHSLVGEGALTAQLALEKSETMLAADFVIEGHVTLTCDRTLKPFLHALSIDQRMIYKYGNDTESTDDDVVMLSWDAQRINVAQVIYELVSLAIPMKKLHPDLPATDEGEEVTFVFQSGDEGDSEEETTKITDPRWAALNKLKKDNR